MCVCACLIVYSFISRIVDRQRWKWILWHNFSFLSILVSSSICLTLSYCLSHWHLLSMILYNTHTYLFLSIFLLPLPVSFTISLSTGGLGSPTLRSLLFRAVCVFWLGKAKKKHENQAWKMAKNDETIPCHLL